MMPCASFDRSGFADTAGSTTSNSSPPRRPTCPCSPITSRQPQRDQPQQRVAGRVAERIVDRLEAVEVEQEHRAAVLPPDRADQRIVERAAKRFAVGEARQRILAREAVELDLRLPHLGQVGSEAAKAEEVAELVVHRPARDRPPDLVLGLGADDQVLEGDVRRQIEAERPLRSRAAVGGLGRDEVGERPVEQVGGLASQRARATLSLMYDNVPSRVVSQNQPFSLFSNSSMSPSARADCGRASSSAEVPPDLSMRLMVPTTTSSSSETS